MATSESENYDEATIKHSLQSQGASESLAGAIADVAVDAGLNRMTISYDDGGPVGKVYVSVSGAVPEPVHERLIDMGFEVIDGYSHDSDDGMRGCKYKDTKY